MTTQYPEPEIVIRSGRLADAPEIARLASELGYPNDAESIGVRLQGLAGDADHWVGVAESAGDGQGLAGWVHVACCMTLESGDYAEILGLVVDARARRQRVGARLVSAAERWARVAGLARLTVRSNSARPESHPFYLALGYARSKSQHVYLKQLDRPVHA